MVDFSTDHSPFQFFLDLRKDENEGKGLWKFNNSLGMNSHFQTKMKFHIKSTLETLAIEGIRDPQVRWEFLKYKNVFNGIFKATSPKHEERKIFFRK